MWFTLKVSNALRYVGYCVPRHAIGKHVLNMPMTNLYPVAVHHSLLGPERHAARQALEPRSLSERLSLISASTQRNCFVGCFTRLINSFINSYS